jgi:hypothetical protein
MGTAPDAHSELRYQSAHQSLITDVLQVPLPPVRDHLFRPLVEAEGLVLARPLTADIRAVLRPHATHHVMFCRLRTCGGIRLDGPAID